MTTSPVEARGATDAGAAATPPRDGRPHGAGPRSRSAGQPLRRLAFLLPAGLSLLVGLDAALMLLGLPAPVQVDRFPDVHGVLLVLGFVGTLISLERAVALGRRAGFAAPALLGIGGLLLVSPAPLAAGRTALVAGTLALVALFVPLWRRQRDDAVLVQLLGAVLAVGGATLWLGGVPVPVLLPWLAAFLVMTIVGERLELARIALRSGTPLVAAAFAMFCVVPATLLWPRAGYPLLGLVTLTMVAWLAVHDIARRTIRATGAPRFMAACMLAGYVWLGVAGATWLVAGEALEGGAYDAVVHAVFLGFTLSMIMAHASVIMPAVLRHPLPYHPVFVAPAALLHGSLVVRLWLGDALGVPAALQVGGALNIAALLGFVGCAVWSATRHKKLRQ